MACTSRDSGIEGDLTDDDVMAEYKEWLEENNKLEWFEQVDLLTEYVLKNGLTGFSLDGDKIKKTMTRPKRSQASPLPPFITITLSTRRLKISVLNSEN